MAEIPDLPPAPNPCADSAIDTNTSDTDGEAHLPGHDEDWKIADLGPHAAIKLLGDSLNALVEATGDVPSGIPAGGFGCSLTGAHTGLTPASLRMVPLATSIRQDHYGKDHDDEVFLSDPFRVENTRFAFFGKKPIEVPIEDYLSHMQKLFPMPAVVYLAAGAYVARVARSGFVPVTPRTVHRLVLASVRVASKILLDRYCNDRIFGAIGGLSLEVMMKLELCFSYLMGYEFILRSEQDLQQQFRELRRIAEGLHKP